MPSIDEIRQIDEKFRDFSRTVLPLGHPIYADKSSESNFD